MTIESLTGKSVVHEENSATDSLNFKVIVDLSKAHEELEEGLKLGIGEFELVGCSVGALLTQLHDFDSSTEELVDCLVAVCEDQDVTDEKVMDVLVRTEEIISEAVCEVIPDFGQDALVGTMTSRELEQGRWLLTFKNYPVNKGQDHDCPGYRLRT